MLIAASATLEAMSSAIASSSRFMSFSVDGGRAECRTSVRRSGNPAAAACAGQ
jgi:hypothetical protein